MIAEWDVPFELVTQLGTLPINQPLESGSTSRFQLTPSKCRGYLPVRETEADDVPQGDGQISHRRWRSGYRVHLALEPLESYDEDSREGESACGATLVDMLDLLGLHVNELIRTGQIGGAGARLYWTPTGHAQRMLNRMQLVQVTAPADEGELGGTQIELDVDSAFPYVMEAAETDTNITDGSTVTINNPGNTDYFAVVQVAGPTTGFTLTNHSVQDLDGVDISLVYDSTLPGGAAIASGDYVEFEFFRETAYRNGNLNNRKGSIDWRVSDFFPLVPGDNLIEIVGADCLVKSNGAWA